MEKAKKALKICLLFVFCLLNTIDVIQTISFLETGTESNRFAVNNPYVWFTLKLIFTFGFPAGLYLLDIHLENREDGDFYGFLRSIIALAYLTVLFADIFYLSIILKNMARLGRLV